MVNVRVARRYAEAFMRAGEDQKVLDAVSKDLEMLERLMKESRELHVFLKSPVIKTDKKQLVIQEMFGTKIHALTMDFLLLLAKKGREELLPDIVQQFFSLLDEKLGIVNVEIRSATDLSKTQHERIQQKFESMTKKKVRLSFSIDKVLKGGFVARVGDTMFDGSVKRQLELLRERFAEDGGLN
ncbi:MAG TPA: ATP synthase F1 subunit delta [Bacteroidota bacterium]